MDIIEMNALDHQYVLNVENQITQNWNVRILSTAQENTLAYSQSYEMWKKE